MKLKDFLWSNLALLTELLCIALVFIGVCGALLSLVRPSKEQMMKKYDCPPPSYEIMANKIAEIKAHLSEIESALTNGTSDISLYAQLISTNLVRIPCSCGYCRPSEGIVVPEHLNQIGYDLKVQVSTSYYPVVSLPTH